MGQNNIANSQLKSELIIKDRSYMSVSGVENVIAFDELSVCLKTNLGELNIDGESLSVSRLCVEDGKIEISGTMYGLYYSDERPKKRGFFGKK